MIYPKDAIMADKGFDVEDLFAQFHMSYQPFWEEEMDDRNSSSRPIIQQACSYRTDYGFCHNF